LRNPLAPIITAAQLLKMSGNDEKRLLQASDVISRQVKHMTNLVDDLLDVSRVTRGIAALNLESVDLEKIVHSAVEQARPLIAARRHELRVSIGAARAYVRGDYTRLVQVLVNLLNNAAKYTPINGVVTLSLEVRANQAKIIVSDTGQGIEPTLLPHIFDLFTQGERTPDRTHGGLGLGLALVKSMTLLHDGEVVASSQGIGKGSTFSVLLPLLPEQPIEVAATAPSAALARHGSCLRVMIVDDNIDAAQSLAALLELHGHQTIIAEDAQSALASAASHPVQVFILDIGLPDMDGYALAGRLRALPATLNATLIALTGYGQAHDRLLSTAAGFDHHFVKPMDFMRLAEILAQER
jgi:CheY-like chemotaxis protein/anti-sigma regulatory factor (Ser/Thr protein kinase)